MRETVKRFSSFAGILLILFGMAFLINCSGGSDAPPPPPSGMVVQGPVVGATVWADHTTGTGANKIKDADEVYTTTKIDGTFKYPSTPSYSYISRSTGGFDSISGKAAMPMAAPSGANTITPITTVVASVPPGAAQNALIATIQAITGNDKYDANPSKSATPAALALSKSIETAMTVMANAVESSAGIGVITSSQLASVQDTVSSAIATQIQQSLTPANAAATLTNATNLGNLVGAAVQAAATSIDTNNTNIGISTTAAAAMNTAVAAAVTNVANGIAANTGGSLGTTPNSAVVEATVMTTTLKDTINAQTEVASDVVAPSIAALSATVTPLAPNVVAGSLYPANGATQVALKSPVTISFDQEIDPTTLSGNFTLTGPSGAVAATVTYNSLTNTAILTPTASLTAGAAGTLYTASCSTGVKGLNSDLAIASATTWTFTTMTDAQVSAATAPAVLTFTPLQAATGVVPTTSITAVFNKALDPSTVTAANFTVAAGASVVAGAVRYNSAANTATFIPGIQLAANTTYTVTLSANIKSAAGMAYVPVAWTFTTGAAVDTTPPTATLATSEAADSNGRVPASVSIIATFSEAMLTGTVTSSNFTLVYADGSGAVGGTVSYNSTNKTATFMTSTLAPGRIFVATLTKGLTDASGNALVAEVKLTFTTAGTPTGSTGTGGGSGGGAF